VIDEIQVNTQHLVDMSKALNLTVPSRWHQIIFSKNCCTVKQRDFSSKSRL